MKISSLHGMSLGALVFLAPHLAFGGCQHVTQNGSVFNGHAVAWMGNCLVADVTGAANSTSPPSGLKSGQGLSETDLLNSNYSVNLFDSNNSGAFHSAQIGFDGSGNFTINLGSYGGAAAQVPKVIQNGVTYPLIAGGGNVTGPNSPFPTSGYDVVWNGNSAVKQGAIAPAIGPTTPVQGGVMQIDRLLEQSTSVFVKNIAGIWPGVNTYSQSAWSRQYTPSTPGTNYNPEFTGLFYAIGGDASSTPVALGAATIAEVDSLKYEAANFLMLSNVGSATHLDANGVELDMELRVGDVATGGGGFNAAAFNNAYALPAFYTSFGGTGGSWGAGFLCAANSIAATSSPASYAGACFQANSGAIGIDVAGGSWTNSGVLLGVDTPTTDQQRVRFGSGGTAGYITDLYNDGTFFHLVSGGASSQIRMQSPNGIMIQQAANQDTYIGGPVTLTTGATITAANDSDTVFLPLEIAASSTLLSRGQLQVRPAGAGQNQDFYLTMHQNLSTGVAFESVNDANNGFEPLEIAASQIDFTNIGSGGFTIAAGGVLVGSATGGVPAAGYINVSGGFEVNGVAISNPTSINGVSFPSSPSTNTVPVVTSSNTITYEAVPNAALANSSVTIGSTAVSLGATVTTFAGMTLSSPTINTPTLTVPLITQATWADNQSCTQGQIVADANYIYACTSTNTVKRAPLSSF